MALRVISSLALMACAAFAADELAGYDKLCPIDLGFGGGPKQARVRKFIIEHWTQRRRAYLCMTASSIEGEPSTTKLYIEPSATGRWHVRGIVHRVNSARSLHRTDAPHEQTVEYDATDVQWRRHERGQRYLVFLDSSGEVITQF